MDFLKILKSMTEADDIGYSDICVMAVITTYAQYNDDHIVEMSIPDIQAEFKRLSIKTIKRKYKVLINRFDLFNKDGSGD